MTNSPAGRPSGADGFDRTSAVLAGLATLALLGAAWLRWGRGRGEVAVAEPPPLGAKAPILLLHDPETRRPVLVEPRPGRVLWVCFWSPAAGPGREAEVVGRLDRIWRRFRSREPFALLIAVPASTPADRWKLALADASPDLPVFLAPAATTAAYGPGRGPLHVLIDEDGRVVATAGGPEAGLEGMAEKAEALLDAIAPTGPRFAAAGRR